MTRYFFLLLLSVILAACNIDPPEERLQGERIPIILESRGLQADPSLQGVRVAVAEPQNIAAWSQVGGSATHNIGNINYAPEFREVWNRNIGSGSSTDKPLFAEPVVANNIVYGMDANYRLTAVDGEDGKVVWQVPLPFEKGDSGLFGGGLFGGNDSGAFGGGLALYKGRVFASSGHGILYAVNADSGEILWQYNLVTPVRSAPVVGGDIVLVTSIDNRTTAFDYESGQPLWTHEAFQENVAVVGTGAAAIIANLAIVPYSSGEIYALRLSDGSVVWQENLSAVTRSSSISELGAISAHPVIHGDRIIAVSNGGRMVALDIRTGTPVWEHRLSGGDTPAVSGNYLFIVSNSSQLLAMRVSDGAIVWERQLPHWRNPDKRAVILNWNGPLLLQGQLFLSNEQGQAVLIDSATGDIVRELSLARVAKGPVVAGGRLYILHSNGALKGYE